MRAIPSLTELSAIKIAETQDEKSILPDGISMRALKLFATAIWKKEGALDHISPKLGCELLRVARYLHLEDSLLPVIMEVAKKQKLLPIQRAWTLEMNLAQISKSYQVALHIKWNPHMSRIKTEQGEQFFINCLELSVKYKHDSRHPLNYIDGIFFSSDRSNIQLISLMECTSTQLARIRAAQVEILNPATEILLKQLPNLQVVFVQREKIIGKMRTIQWEQVEYKNSNEPIDWTVLFSERPKDKKTLVRQAHLYLDRHMPRSLREAWLKAVLNDEKREEWVIPKIVRQLIYEYPQLENAELSESILQQLGSALDKVSSPKTWELLHHSPSTYSELINSLEIRKRLLGKNPTNKLLRIELCPLLRAKEMDEDLVRKAFDLVDDDNRENLRNLVITSIFPFQEMIGEKLMNIYPGPLTEVLRENRFLWLLKDVPIGLIFDKVEHLPLALELRDCGLRIEKLNLLSPTVVPFAATLRQLFPTVKELMVPAETNFSALPVVSMLECKIQHMRSSEDMVSAKFNYRRAYKYIQSLQEGLRLADAGDTIPLTLLLGAEPAYQVPEEVYVQMVDIGIGALRAGCKLDSKTMKSLRKWSEYCPPNEKWVQLKNGDVTVRVDHRRFSVLSEKCAKESCLTWACNSSTIHQFADWLNGHFLSSAPQEIADLIAIAHDLGIAELFEDIKRYLMSLDAESSFNMYDDWYEACLRNLSESDFTEIHKRWTLSWNNNILGPRECFRTFGLNDLEISFESIGYLCEMSERGAFLRKHFRSLILPYLPKERHQDFMKLLPSALRNHFTSINNVKVECDESIEVFTGFLPAGLPLHDLGLVIDSSITASQIKEAAAVIPNNITQLATLKKKLLEVALSRA